VKDFLNTLKETTTTQQPNMAENPFFINLPVVPTSAASTTTDTTLPDGGSVAGGAAEASTTSGGILGLGGIMRGLRFN
jgi:hypothetical protein